MDNDHAYNDRNIDIQACSVTDCTGLIPAKPAREEELNHYEELYPYLARAACEEEKHRN